jgi:AraC family transcriptional regulator
MLRYHDGGACIFLPKNQIGDGAVPVFVPAGHVWIESGRFGTCCIFLASCRDCRLIVPTATVQIEVRRSPHNPALTQATWGAVTAEHMVIPGPVAYDATYAGQRHQLMLLDITRSNGESRLESLPASTLRDLRGRVTFVPAGCAFSSWGESAHAPLAFTSFYFNGDLAFPDSAARAARSFRPLLHFEDSSIRATASKLRALMLEADASNRVYADTLAALLTLELQRLQGALPAAPTPARGGLAPWQQHRVLEHIEAQLADDLSLQSLAAIVDLSPFYFARAFRQSVGSSPHQFILARRIQRAKEFLAKPNVPIAVIARATGFSDPAKLARAFRKATGMTPSACRRDLLT